MCAAPPSPALPAAPIPTGRAGTAALGFPRLRRQLLKHIRAGTESGAVVINDRKITSSREADPLRSQLS